MSKKILTIIILFLLSLPICLSQESQISIEFKGYGETTQEIYLKVRNTGDVYVKNITVSVDGKQYQTYHSSIGPGIGIEIRLNLKPGEHKIEIETLEGAYDSLDIIVPSSPKESELPVRSTEIPTQESFLEKNKIWIALILVAIIIVVIWLLTKKPKLY